MPDGPVRQDDRVTVDIIEDLSWRGLIAQSTDLGAFAGHLREQPRSLYCGFDPTAPSLHLGHLLQTLTLRRFQLAGHRPIGLVGGATGLIGDPKMTGERTLNDTDVVEAWVLRIREQVERFLDFDDPATGARLVNNMDWTRDLSTIGFLRDIGKHFSVNRMLDREAVAARLAGPGISYTEFSYQLLQSNDFLELYQRHDCTLQTGGSDQWGNIVAGVDLIRRAAGGHAHALTTPLLLKSDGTKFGKTESGTVWLDPGTHLAVRVLPVLVNTEDELVSTLLRTLTFRDRDDIEALEAATVDQPHARSASGPGAGPHHARYTGRRSSCCRVGEPRAVRPRSGRLTPTTLGAALHEAPHVRVRQVRFRRWSTCWRRPIGGEQVGGSTRDYRRWCLPQQRPRHRSGGRTGRGRPDPRPMAGAARGKRSLAGVEVV